MTSRAPTFMAGPVTRVKLYNGNQRSDRYLVWITKLAGPQAGIAELSLLAPKR
jgi:hypothetical protein